jgi:murein L,D-transpeptidase YafK
VRAAPSLVCLVLALGGCRAAAETEDVSPPAPVAASASAAAAPVTPPDERCPADLACDLDAWARTPRPRVDEVLVEKRAHRLTLVAGGRAIRVYAVALGWGGLGQKRYEGDGVTPIGTFHVKGRYPSKWHTYLALDYPTAADESRWAAARERGEIPAGKGPGSAIAIHGHRADQPERLHKLVDWTLGCVALDRAEIDEVADAAPVGTRVRIVP